MLRIERHNIELTRGDSTRFTILLKNRVLPDGTKALFTVKDTVWEPAGSAIEMYLDVMDNKVHVILEPEDTRMDPGDYVWDLRVLEPDGEGSAHVLTPMEYGRIRVLEVVGR